MPRQANKCAARLLMNPLPYSLYFCQVLDKDLIHVVKSTELSGSRQKE
jgi:hypothetical protein